jgi:hypothetical protein
MTQQRRVIADKSFILMMALRMTCCRAPASRATRRPCLQRAHDIKAMWIDAKEGRKTVCSPWQTYSASFGRCFSYWREGELKA